MILVLRNFSLYEKKYRTLNGRFWCYSIDSKYGIIGDRRRCCMTYGKPVSWRDFPDSPGKRILEEILTTPRPDFTQLDKDVADYEKKRAEERKERALKKAQK